MTQVPATLMLPALVLGNVALFSGTVTAGHVIAAAMALRKEDPEQR